MCVHLSNASAIYKQFKGIIYLKPINATNAKTKSSRIRSIIHQCRCSWTLPWRLHRRLRFSHRTMLQGLLITSITTIQPSIEFRSVFKWRPLAALCTCCTMSLAKEETKVGKRYPLILALRGHNANGKKSRRTILHSKYFLLFHLSVSPPCPPSQSKCSGITESTFGNSFKNSFRFVTLVLRSVLLFGTFNTHTYTDTSLADYGSHCWHLMHIRCWSDDSVSCQYGVHGTSLPLSPPRSFGIPLCHNTNCQWQASVDTCRIGNTGWRDTCCRYPVPVHYWSYWSIDQTVFHCAFDVQSHPRNPRVNCSIWIFLGETPPTGNKSIRSIALIELIGGWSLAIVVTSYDSWETCPWEWSFRECVHWGDDASI